MVLRELSLLNFSSTAKLSTRQKLATFGTLELVCQPDHSLTTADYRAVSIGEQLTDSTPYLARVNEVQMMVSEPSL